jgi:2-keto-4-pentenoate hydratase
VTPDRIREAAELLWSLWQRGECIDALPPGCRPGTRADGYRIQEQVLSVSGRPQFGWKIAATSIAGQAHIGVDGPIAGRLLEGQVAQENGAVPLRGCRMRVAEPEFAFRMGRDLPPRGSAYREAEVLAAVASLHPAIEIPDSRYGDFARVGAAQLIADNACAHRFVLGRATHADWRAIDLSRHEVCGEVAGKLARGGSGGNVLGGPGIALTWLVNELSGLGVTLGAGQVVTTGTCLAPLEVAPGDRVWADFGVLGRIEVRFGG